MTVRYTATALFEINEIYAYLVERNPNAAKRVLDQIQQTIALIAAMPEIGAVKYQQIVRMFPVRRYSQFLVFYRLDEEGVLILNVRHGARRPLSLDTD